MIARTTVARIAACGALAVTLTLAQDGVRAVAADEARYRTLFQDPGETPTTDLSLEQHAIALIAATPAGAHIGFAFRDFNRRPVADALIAAHRRGVIVDGVIDGGERTRGVVRDLQAALGADRLVLCGSPAFTFHSCITNVDPPSLQHNKFLTFSLLADGREDVVLQTSMNFLEPSQLSYYNDMVEIAGDHALYDAYVEFLMDMKAQARTDDRYEIRWGDDGRTAIFPSPRRQPDPFTDDTIVDRMNEIDCSEGGTIRAANMAFRSERIVILHKLIELQRAGCDVEVVLSNADGDIMTGLLLAGIPVHPFFLRAVAPRPQVIVHDKFWLVDARSAVTGRRVKLTYAGSSNWRGDQQRSDDLLLRIDDDDVYADYLAYWEKIRSRAASDLPRPATDAVAPGRATPSRPPPVPPVGTGPRRGPRGGERRSPADRGRPRLAAGAAQRCADRQLGGGRRARRLQRAARRDRRRGNHDSHASGAGRLRSCGRGAVGGDQDRQDGAGRPRAAGTLHALASERPARARRRRLGERRPIGSRGSRRDRHEQRARRRRRHRDRRWERLPAGGEAAERSRPRVRDPRDRVRRRRQRRHLRGRVRRAAFARLAPSGR